jgi:disulfide bond formation protein DsbB
MIEIISLLLSTLTVVAHIGLLILSILILTSRKKIALQKEYFWLIAAIVALGSIGGSLFYSEVMRFTPCLLCLLERSLIYPLFPISLVALFYKKTDKYLRPIAFALGLVGGIISFYHSLLQTDFFLLGDLMTLCGANSGTLCTERYFVAYDYVTIPVMALTSFLIIILAVLITSPPSKK